MNKVSKVLLAILGGIERLFYITSPIILGLFWIKLFGLEKLGSYLFFGISLLASIFRAIKVGSGGDFTLYGDLLRKIVRGKNE